MWVNVVATAVLFLVLHVAIWRLWPSNAPRVVLFFALAGGCIAGSLAASLLKEGPQLGTLFALAGTESLLVIFYSLVYGTLARSVSVTLLGRLLREKNSTLDFEVLLEEYLRSNRFDDRLHVMAQSGFVAVAGDQVALTEKGERLAKIAEFFGSVFSDGLEG